MIYFGLAGMLMNFAYLYFREDSTDLNWNHWQKNALALIIGFIAITITFLLISESERNNIVGILIFSYFVISVLACIYVLFRRIRS